MKNKMTDLNNNLFLCIERLNDEDLTGEKLEAEIKRSKAVAEVATQVIRNAELSLNVIKMADEMGYSLKTNTEALNLLGLENE